MRKSYIVIVVLAASIAIFTLSDGYMLFKKHAITKTVPVKKELKEVIKPRYKKAPEFMLLDIDGSQKKLSDFKNNIVILDFWATWCPPCRKEIPHFIELYETYKSRGLEIIGVALDWNGERVVGPFAKEHNINYTVLLGNDSVADLYGGIVSIPTTFILDRDGNIRKKYVGYMAKEVFEKDIEGLL